MQRFPASTQGYNTPTKMLAPHMANLSVALQGDALCAAGCLSECVVLYWISSITSLPICGGDVPVCGSDQAWRFGYVHTGLLAHVDSPFRDGLDAECLLFWTVLGAGGLPSAPLGRLAQGRRRVHVLPALCLVEKLFPGLDAARAHPRTFLSVHISEKGPGTPAKRLKAALGAGAVLAILSSADGGLVLPGAWVLQRTTKGSGIRGLSRVSAWLVRHGLEADGPAILAVGAAT